MMDPNTLISIVAFSVLTLLWLTFGYGVLCNQAILSTAWRTFRGWNFLVQIGVALLVLPVVLGLWIWQAKWPGWLRLVLVAGLAWVTVYTFFPASVF